MLHGILVPQLGIKPFPAVETQTVPPVKAKGLFSLFCLKDANSTMITSNNLMILI